MAERNESVYIWHDVEGRDPFFDAPDVFAELRRRQQRRRLLPAAAALYRETLELHPQYVLENGVDFAHFKFVHKTPIVPVFTRHDFDDPVSYVDFTITFEGDDEQAIDDVKSGVEAINGGLGVAVTKSWGMVDNRTISAITPVDDDTSDVRFMVYIGRTPSSRTRRGPRTKAQEFGEEIIRQFTQDVHIWQHQRYSDPPALSASEYEGFTAIRKWAMQFYPDGRGGSAAELQAESPTEGLKGMICMSANQAGPRVPGGHRQRRHRDDQADRQPARSRTHRIALLHSGEGRPRRRRDRRVWHPNGVMATGTVEEIIAAKPDVLTFHGVFPDEDLYVKVLEAGINIVTTADWITGWHRDTNHPHPSGKPVTQLLRPRRARRAGRRSTAPG